MDTHPSIDLPEDLRRIQKKWIQARQEEQDIIYAYEFGPAFAPLFAKLPLHGATTAVPAFKALVSVLGLSWQPVALIAAWTKPERILVLGTQESLNRKVGEEMVSQTIARISGIPQGRFSFREVGDSDELGFYREVRKFIEKHRLGSHQVAIDPTGGKKSMSAAATLAGFLKGAWILYVDYAQYHPVKRIPLAGTEYPRLVRNPLEVFGDLEFEKVKEAYRAGNYEEAYHLSEDLAARLYEPREAEALSLLCRAYGAWHRFNFEEAHELMMKLTTHLRNFSSIGQWPWTRDLLSKTSAQCSVLKELAELTARLEKGQKPSSLEEGLPLVLNHLAAAERYVSHHQTGAAMLLTYATLERYVDLCLWTFYGLDDENPDFSRLELDQNIYHEIGQQLHGKKYQKRELVGPISLSLGVQLLATLKPDFLHPQFMGRIKGLMNHRNKTEFEHGLSSKAVSQNDVLRHIATVRDILGVGLSKMGITLDNKLGKYVYPSI